MIGAVAVVLLTVLIFLGISIIPALFFEVLEEMFKLLFSSFISTL